MPSGAAKLRGGDIIAKHNNFLVSKFVAEDVKQKEVAAEMGINARVFNNKLRLRTVNGYQARFTDEQKEWLAERFGIDASEIE